MDAGGRRACFPRQTARSRGWIVAAYVAGLGVCHTGAVVKVFAGHCAATMVVGVAVVALGWEMGVEILVSCNHEIPINCTSLDVLAHGALQERHSSHSLTPPRPDTTTRVLPSRFH
eukprot:scaffold2455_cov387-Prasinococcus_capsulatus_cf.AAC.8